MKDQRSFQCLWMGQSLANMGDVFYIIGIIQLINTLTGSVFAMTMVPFILTTASFVSGFLTPVLIDRYPLKPLLFYSQSGKTGVLLLLSVFVPFLNSVIFIFIVVILIGLLDGCATPVRNALVPYYVSNHQLVKANSFLATMDQTIRLGGWPVGGILMVWMGTGSYLWLILILFAAASVMIAYLAPIKKENRETPSKMWSSMREGWLILWHNRVLRTISVMDILETIANVVWIAAIMYVYVDEVLGVGKEWWGYINGAFFGGLMLGGLVSIKGAPLITRSPKTFILVGLLGTSLVTFIFGIGPTAIMALLLSIFMGFLGQIKDITQQTIVQTNVKVEQLAKVYSAQGTYMACVFGCASLGMGALADSFGVRSIFYLAAALLLLALIVAVFNHRLFLIHSEE
jgi:MFS family permease